MQISSTAKKRNIRYNAENVRYKEILQQEQKDSHQSNLYNNIYENVDYSGDDRNN